MNLFLVTNPYEIKAYERYQKPIEELNHYDITKLIDIYMDILNNGVNIYILRKEGIEKEYIEKDYGFGHKKGLEYGKDIELYGSDFAEYISYDLKDEDVNNFNNGTFKEKLIEKLKFCLDYDDKDGKIEWQINSTENKIIELPYNCYIDYTAYQREDNKEFKRAVDVIFDKDFDFKKKRDSTVLVKYETPEGIIKEEKKILSCVNRDDKTYYNISFSNLLIIDADSIAKAELGNYTCDRMVEEERFREYKEWEKTLDGNEFDFDTFYFEQLTEEERESVKRAVEN